MIPRVIGADICAKGLTEAQPSVSVNDLCRSQNNIFQSLEKIEDKMDWTLETLLTAVIDFSPRSTQMVAVKGRILDCSADDAECKDRLSVPRCDHTDINV